MSKLKRSILLVLVLSFISAGLISYSSKITTERLEYKAGKDGNISTRELAMLASLVYEDVPTEENWGRKNEKCKVSNNDGFVYNIKGDECFFSQEKEETGTLKTTPKGDFEIPYYIEGMSSRKLNSVMGTLMAEEEPGQYYYFTTFADVDELEGWSIIAYGNRKHDDNEDANRPGWMNTFDSITFKKGNNYVIAYRGTDFPDLKEWLFTDILSYAATGLNEQAKDAYEYAQLQYKSIISSNSDAKIYVTGHSLGAYLAQIGGAAIVDYEAGIDNLKDEITPISSSSISDYTDKYKPKNDTSHLIQTGYFNGMGVNSALNLKTNFASNIQNALIYLSTHDLNGNLSNGDRSVNYSDNVKSSGRLVLYSMEEDPISNVGLHYGEIFKLEAAADAKTKHMNHSLNIANLSNKIENLNEYNAEKLEELKKLGINNISDYIKNLFQMTSNLISSLSEKSTLESENNGNSSIPTFVTSNNSNIKSYGAGNTATNVLKALDNYINDGSSDLGEFLRSLLEKIVDGSFMPNFLEYANVNHETDSFACITDKDNGKLTEDKIDFKVKFNNFDSKFCPTDTYACYLFEDYKLEGYIIGDDTSDYEDLPSISLEANITGACAKFYEWYYILSGETTSHSLGTTTNNKIYIKDLASLGITEENIYEVTFSVVPRWGTSYNVKKLNSTSVDGINTYNSTASGQNYNPTLEGDVLVPELTVSKSKTVNINYSNSPIEIKGSNKTNCVSNKCYTNTKYVLDNKIELMSTNKNESLKHNWSYSYDNNDYKSIGDNTYKIIIPEEVLNALEENSRTTIYIKDEICDDSNSCSKTQTTLNYIYDTTPPVCYFNNETDTKKITLESGTWGRVKSKTKQFQFICLSDDEEDFKDLKVSSKAFDIESKVAEITKVASYSYDTKKFLLVNVDVKINKVPADGSENYFAYKTYGNYQIKDLAGNEAKIKEGTFSTIKLKIYKD